VRRAAFLSAALLLTGCGGSATVAVPGGDADRAPDLIRTYGCGGCHAIPGITGADGRVGPDLAGIDERRYIAGVLPNTPENLVRWIVNPPAVSPSTLMPDLGVGDPQARDIAAYLYDH
jgi:cytochrome c